jgi:hypothetical protein
MPLLPFSSPVYVARRLAKFQDDEVSQLLLIFDESCRRRRIVVETNPQIIRHHTVIIADDEWRDRAEASMRALPFA